MTSRTTSEPSSGNTVSNDLQPLSSTCTTEYVEALKDKMQARKHRETKLKTLGRTLEGHFHLLTHLDLNKSDLGTDMISALSSTTV